MPEKNINLVGARLEEIEAVIREWKEPIYRARQIYTGIYRRLLRDWDRFTDLGKELRAKLKERFCLGYPALRKSFVAHDGTVRYLLQLASGDLIECVYIPEERRDTLCISTQVGCAVGCLYCATGRLPLKRNLSPGEIVGQVLLMESERSSTTKRVNVVIMGMGEPLNNYNNVMTAIRLMSDKQGMSISPRRITLSTSGVVPGIRKLAQEDIQPNLAVSLCATTDAVRDMLIPINKKWNIATLLEICRQLPIERRRRITFEYVLIDGINDSPEDARRLARLLQGLKKKINLIPLNPHPWIPLKAPSPEKVLEFHRILMEKNITVNIRRPRGQDVSAACGMLAGSEQAIIAGNVDAADDNEV